MTGVPGELRAVPGGGLTEDASARNAARRDWSGLAGEPPLAVARPESVEAVQALLAACHRHRQAVVPQGGLTGLAGGACTGAGEVALSLSRLSGVIEIDRAARTLTCFAGTPLHVAQAAAEAEGLLLPVDLPARGTCQVGGNIATNAGGLRVIRHGTMRANVLGLEAVLADGALVGGLQKMVKSSLGPDLRALMIGSEGTLGVVTRAVLRLAPLPAARLTALLASSDFDAVLRLLARARDGLPGLSAFEAMWADHYGWNARANGTRLFAETPPLSVILEAEGDGSPAEARRFEAVLAAALEAGEATDAIVPQSGREVAAIWAVREGMAMDAAMPGLVNLDVSLPPSRLGVFADACGVALARALPGAAVFRFGHVGDGNLHVCVHEAEGTDAARRVDAAVYPVVAAMGGAISAEHGIGLLKRDWLHLSRSPADLAALRQVKRALDPNGILNPGKVLRD